MGEARRAYHAGGASQLPHAAIFTERGKAPPSMTYLGGCGCTRADIDVDGPVSCDLGRIQQTNSGPVRHGCRPVTRLTYRLRGARKIKAKLAEKHLSSLTRIKVETDAAGVVWLSGRAPPEDARDLAGMIAKNTDGVNAVHQRYCDRRAGASYGEGVAAGEAAAAPRLGSSCTNRSARRPMHALTPSAIAE